MYTKKQKKYLTMRVDDRSPLFIKDILKLPFGLNSIMPALPQYLRNKTE